MAKEKKESSCAVKRKTSIGGQALIEGIMMRGPKKTAMAVRDPQGEIVFEESVNKATKRSRITKLPIIRGVFGFIDSMAMGYKCLMRSAELSGLEEAEAELQREKEEKQAKKAAEKAEKLAKKKGIDPEVALREIKAEDSKKTSEKPKKADGKEGSSPLVTVIMVLSVVFAVVLAVGLFFYLPSFVFGLLTKAAPVLLFPDNLALASFVKSLFEGVFKIVMLVAYMSLVSLMKDIRRTFQYHGAEHKTIFCYEHGMALTVENVRRERRFHPRCGTSFLILMVLVNVFVSFFIDPISYLILGYTLNNLLRTAIRLLLLPLIMGLGYEVLKFAGRHDNLFTRIVSAPGMWLQRITVLEPDDDMIECAIKAFVAVIPEEEIEEEMAKIRAEKGESDAPEKTETETESEETPKPEAEPNEAPKSDPEPTEPA